MVIGSFWWVVVYEMLSGGGSNDGSSNSAAFNLSDGNSNKTLTIIGHLLLPKK